MTQQWDEFSKSLAEKMPRRESLRLFGAALAGAVLSPLGLQPAGAAGPDPCKAFCRCSNKAQQNACLAVCRTCNGPGRMGGSCGSHVCCATAACSGVCSDLRSDPNCGACGQDCRDFGETCCGTYCADLDNDFSNCGSCGGACDAAGPYEEGACVAGQCVYACLEGAVDCEGTCTSVLDDSQNCGACGNVCGADTPDCDEGVCTASICPGGAICNGTCTDILWDALNCGGCGHQCASLEHCSWGNCEGDYDYGY